MDPRSPTFEANLLYKTAPVFTRETLVENFRCALTNHGETLLNVEQIDSVFTLMTCDSIDILFAYCAAPLPAEHFLGAERPAVNSFSEAEILRRLTDNSASFTILVSDRNLDDKPFGAAHESLKRAVCWDLTDCIQEQIFADLVFWSDTDTLYAGEEFDRACTYCDSQDTGASGSTDLSDLPAMPRTTDHLQRPPMVDGAALDWLNGHVEESREEFHIDMDDIIELNPHGDSFRSVVAAAIAPRGPANLHHSPWIPMNGIAMACTAATIGLSIVPSLNLLLA